MTRFAAWVCKLIDRMQPNKRLFKLIRRAENRLRTASNMEDIRSIVELFRELDAPITFRYLPVFLSVGLGVIVWLILVKTNIAEAYPWLSQKRPDASFALQDVLLLCAIVIPITIVLRFRSYRKAFDALSSNLHRKYAYLLHDIKPAPVNDDLAELASHFVEFRRGSFGRYLSNKLVGSYQGVTHTLSFTYYEYHYVVRKRNSKGQTSKTKHERFALICEFPSVGNVHIRGDNRAQPMVIVPPLFGADNGTEPPQKNELHEHYRSSSSAFNQRFWVMGNTKIACARVLKPITTLTLLEHTDSLKNLNIQFADERLCMSFDNKNMLDLATRTTLYNPEAMLREMQGGIDNYRIPLLEHYLKLNHQLACQHDDNFSLSPAAPA